MIRCLTFCLLILILSCDKDKKFDTIGHFKTLPLLGADLSLLPELRESGIQLYNINGIVKDPLEMLREEGMSVVRLRLWTDENDPNSSFYRVKKLSSEIKSKGMKTLVSVHYSDSWADPAKQSKPQKWRNVPYDKLRDSFVNYTAKICKELRPDYIQIGNEINNGFLWPDGHIDQENQMLELLSLGVKQVRYYCPDTKIIIHYAGTDGAKYFFNKLKNIDYDIIGISYYPIWHGTDFSLIEHQLNLLHVKCNKDILLVETAYPFTLEWNDWTNNIIGLESQLHPDFPASPEGQKQFIKAIKDMMKGVKGGIGFCYWGGEWVSFKGRQALDGSTWENQTFWDFSNNRLPVLDVFRD